MRAAAAILLLAACGGDATTPTASGVFPAEAFTGRTLRVEISGDATSWKPGATVDFGAGITVNAVDVASPTDLFAAITIDPTTPVGKHDVTVTSGGTYTLTKAFELVSPIGISYSGDVAQLGVPNFTIDNLDFESPFDITQDPTTAAYTNLAIDSPAGTEFVIKSATPYRLSGQVFIDAGGMAGPVSVASGELTSVGDAIDVMPRTAMAFSGTATGNFGALGASDVYAVAASGNSILHYTLSPSDPNASPGSGILGSGGTWRSDFLGAGHAVIDATAYVVVVNLGGSGYSYTLTGAADAVAAAAEATGTANDSPTTAPAAAIPYEVAPATLASATDKDYFKVTIAAASANQRLHVVTDPGNPDTDTAVDVTDCSPTTPTSYTDNGFGGSGPIDNSKCSFFSCTGLFEDVRTKPLAAGTYCIEILAGANYATSSTDYVAAWWLE